MIRISETFGDTGPVIHIAGRLEERHLAELGTFVGDRARAIALDVSELQSADAECVVWLSELADRGVEVIGATPYIALLIDRARPAAQANPDVGQ